MIVRGAGLARWWVDRYTRGLPLEARERRCAEVDSDVDDQLRSTDARFVDIGWRTVRGVPADLAWRRAVRTEARGSSRIRATWRVVTQAWFAPLAVLVGAFDLVLAWGVATEPDAKMPGQAVGPIVMATLGVALFVGLWLRWRAAVIVGEVSADAPAASVPRPALADGLIVVGVLPALAFFWMVVPALVAIAVIAGVAGVGRRVGSS